MITLFFERYQPDAAAYQQQEREILSFQESLAGEDCGENGTEDRLQKVEHTDHAHPVVFEQCDPKGLSHRRIQDKIPQNQR
jgi:hypothetical protein